MRIIVALLCCTILCPFVTAYGGSVTTCRCADKDEELDELWDFSRRYPSMSWMEYDPFSYLFCCNCWREEAMAELNPVWTRIKSSLKDIRSRWSSLSSPNRRKFSLLMQFSDLEAKYQDLCHEMAQESISLVVKNHCTSTGCREGRRCYCLDFGPRHIPKVESDGECSLYTSKLKQIEARREKLTKAFEAVYKDCLMRHRCLTTYYEYGLLCQSQGKYWKSAFLMTEYIQRLKETGSNITVESYIDLNTSYQLMFQYDKTIEVLTEAIQKYPDKKELYVRRVAAYFELGRTDEAIQDFMAANLEEQLTPDPYRTIETKAFVKGASSGLAEGLREFPTSCLYSLRGAGQLLWAGVTHPIGVPLSLMNDLQSFTEVLKRGEFGEILQQVAPELQALATSWDALPLDDRWEKLGFSFGKYGFDVLFSLGTRKACDLFLKLKSTNTLCNVKTLTSPEGKVPITLTAEQIAKKRGEFFSQTKIQWDKQGKHIEGHNSRNTLQPKDLETYSILTHKDPEELLKNHAGKGAPKPIRGQHPWETGYREDVDFGQTIGIWKSEVTKESKETSWGRIHYGKDGAAHIVPIQPKE